MQKSLLPNCQKIAGWRKERGRNGKCELSGGERRELALMLEPDLTVFSYIKGSVKCEWSGAALRLGLNQLRLKAQTYRQPQGEAQ